LLIKKHKINYHVFDADPVSVADITARGAAAGLDGSNFAIGEISRLPFTKQFDFVFSSHCLEHAIDIVGTLKEIFRVLKEGGQLFMSVPLGFDTSDEHTLFLGPHQWAEILMSLGFTFVASTVGSVYTESGDLCILAQKCATGNSNEEAARRIATRYAKAGKFFISHTDAAFRFPATVRRSDGHSIFRAVGASCQVSLDRPPTTLIIVRHPWSGIIRVTDGVSSIDLDCYHPQFHLEGVDLVGMGKDFRVELIGKSLAARDAQVAISGALVAGSQAS
jgi:SAM-dependent methyltransferase